MDAVQSTLGLAVIAPDYKEKLNQVQEISLVTEFPHLLGDVANVVTVAGALPALSAAIQSTLSLLSK